MLLLGTGLRKIFPEGKAALPAYNAAAAIQCQSRAQRVAYKVTCNPAFDLCNHPVTAIDVVDEQCSAAAIVLVNDMRILPDVVSRRSTGKLLVALIRLIVSVCRC